MRTARNLWWSLRFLRRYRHLAGTRKVIYTGTPNPSLRNLGDHAQVVAIYEWIQRHFPGLDVIEVDKRESVRAIRALRRIVGPDDVILLQSGGNLGDRGRPSEKARRAIIENFHDNQIISLPQTIFFSDTEVGRREREISRAIYAEHPNLTVIGRDPRSGELAKELFPGATSFCAPDFVLALEPRPGKSLDVENPRVLLCLRLDDESVLDEATRQALADALPYETRFFNTVVEERIERNERVKWVDDVLDLFGRYDAVVTDRFHGLIFSVIARRPTVVLRTVDHKLTSAFHWFDAVDFVRFAESPDQVPEVLEKVLRSTDFSTPDWNADYFDRILDLVESGGV